MLRLGIDLGGTKIAGIALAPGGAVTAEHRLAAPRHDYVATLAAIGEMVAWLEREAGGRGTVGVGMPGSIAPRGDAVQNANSTWLNGRPFARDLQARLGRPVRLANDANCFALSEAVDGAGAGAPSVFGGILGTGCGGGLVLGGRLIDGPLGIAGEWGHNPLPWPAPDEYPGPACWCGRRGCMETWVSGSGLEADHARVAGESLSGAEIVARAEVGDVAARATLDRHADRLARGLAHVVNIFDPHVIVLGGGLSGLAHLYAVLPGRIARHVFAAQPRVTVKPPRWGDASGVRGAAWLWAKPDSAGEHPDDRIRALLQDCPFLMDRLDLSEGPYYIMGQTAQFIRDGELSDVETASVFAHLDKMARLDEDTRNLLVVGVLEMLADNPQSIECTRAGLTGEEARALFERVLNGWT